MANWLEEQNERFLTSGNSKMLSCKIIPLSTNAIAVSLACHLSGELFIVYIFVSVLVSQSCCHSFLVFIDTELPACMQPSHGFVSLIYSIIFVILFLI